MAIHDDQVIGAPMSERLAANIAAMAERRRRERSEAPLGDRIAQRITCFTGSISFVVLHLVLYGGWIIANLGWIPGVEPWDETFVMLAMEASVEAIFLSTFVLINQNRQGAEADRRAELDLQVSLLAEDELTKLAHLLEAIAERLEVPVERDSLAEIEKDVDAEAVLDALDAHDPQEPSSATAAARAAGEAPSMKDSTAS